MSTAPDAAAVAGPEPRSGPPAVPVVVVLALALLGVAAVCVHDLLARADLVGTAPALPAVARAVDAHSMTPWAPWVASGVVALGLLVVARSLAPRRRTHLAACDGTLWLRPTDLARLCSAAALAQPGVADAHTRVSRRRVDVTARSAGGPGDDVAARVEAAVADVLAALDSSPRLRVTTTAAART